MLTPYSCAFLCDRGHDLSEVQSFPPLCQQSLFGNIKLRNAGRLPAFAPGAYLDIPCARLREHWFGHVNSRGDGLPLSPDPGVVFRLRADQQNLRLANGLVMGVEDMDLERYLHAGLQLRSWLEANSEIGRWILGKYQPDGKEERKKEFHAPIVWPGAVQETSALVAMDIGQGCRRRASEGAHLCEPPTGGGLGNLPRAFTHVGRISADYDLDRHLR